jgi:hypothetical protein
MKKSEVVGEKPNNVLNYIIKVIIMKQNSPLKTFCNAKKPEKKRGQQRKKVIRTATNVTTRIIQSHLTSSTNRALAKIQRPEQMVHLKHQKKNKEKQRKTRHKQM